MRIENYISDLLYRYQCVIVPGLGAFLTQQKSSQLHSTTNAFYPPTKELSFNAQLTTNDGLLGNYISDIENIPYENVLENIQGIVASWKKLLEQKEKLVLKNVGELSLNNESNIQFTPSRHLNYLTSSFGLSSFVSSEITREVYKEEVIAIEENTPLLFTPERREPTPYLKYAAIAILTVSIGAFGFKFFKNQEQKQLELVNQKVQQQVEQTVQQATFFDTKPVVLPSITLDVKKEIKKYKIVAGAFRIKANADKKVSLLKNKGYNAQRIEKNKYGLHQVLYASFSDVNESLVYLRKIKATESSEAWLLVSE